MVKNNSNSNNRNSSKKQQEIVEKDFIPKQIKYKVFDNNNYFQQAPDKTTIILAGVPATEMYNYIEQTLKKRFFEYKIKINHPGRTVSIIDVKPVKGKK